MPYARELKKNLIVIVDDRYYMVRQLDSKSPSARGAQTLYKIRFSSVPGNKKFDKTYPGDEWIPEASLLRRSVSLLFREGNECTFMDSDDFNQYLVNTNTIDAQLKYINDGQEGITALLINNQIIGIELPPSVTLEIVDTAPAIKGASASGITKLAKLASGIEIQIPEYLGTGEIIKVNTETGKFISRVND